LIVTRISYFACLCVLAVPFAFGFQAGPASPQDQQQRTGTDVQKPGSTPSATVKQSPGEEDPPEEDESIAPEKFALNPLESERNIKVGNYYWHKGKYRAAAGRYERAAKFNPNSAEAFFKLGEAEDKLKNKDAARVAYERVTKIAPDSKLAQEARKKLGKG
jgi:tetratricopeptide (TPR) repeat protein